MTMIVRFSIITVCKNDLENLKRTRETVFAQSGGNHEWIVMDGGSEDGTAEYLRELKETGLLWESGPDRGLYDAMNKGLSKANGEYVLFLNAGDCFASEETLSNLVECFKKDPVSDLVYGDAVIVYPDGKEFFERARPPSYFRYGQPIYHQAILYKREAIGSIRFHPEKYRVTADYAFALEMIAKGARVRRLSIPVCKFYLGGISSENTFRILKEVWMAQRDILHVSVGIRVWSYFIHLFAMLAKERVPWLFQSLHKIYRKFTPA